jgi:hypothetical protein
MDPQAVWDQMLTARDEKDWDTAETLAEALFEWLDKGGFPPRARHDVPVTDARNRRRVQAMCELIYRQARQARRSS